MKRLVLAWILGIVCAGASAAITVVNESSLVALPESPFTAMIVPGPYGPELVVAGTVSELTAANEHLVSAEIKFVATQADGSVLWSGGSDVTGVNYLAWHVLVKPAGILDGNLIAQVKMTDGEIVTKERLDREEKQAAETARQAILQREREERAQMENARQAARKRERERQIAIQAQHWPKQIERAVVDRRVTVGMTAQRVSMAWGAPDHVNETIRAAGKSEQWVYSLSSYVYFENGLVTAIQRSR